MLLPASSVRFCPALIEPVASSFFWFSSLYCVSLVAASLVMFSACSIASTFARIVPLLVIFFSDLTVKFSLAISPLLPTFPARKATVPSLLMLPMFLISCLEYSSTSPPTMSAPSGRKSSLRTCARNTSGTRTFSPLTTSSTSQTISVVRLAICSAVSATPTFKSIASATTAPAFIRAANCSISLP